MRRGRSLAINQRFVSPSGAINQSIIPSADSATETLPLAVGSLHRVINTIEIGFLLLLLHTILTSDSKPFFSPSLSLSFLGHPLLLLTGAPSSFRRSSAVLYIPSKKALISSSSRIENEAFLGIWHIVLPGI